MNFTLSTSPLWLLPCLLAGVGYAWLLYSKVTPWSRRLNLALAAVRAVVVAFLAFLLLGPMLRYVQQYAEAPTVVLALDDSESVGLYNAPDALAQLRTGLAGVLSTLEAAGYRTEIRTLSGGLRTREGSAAGPLLDSLQFRAAVTNLDALLQGVRSDYENRNLAATVLVSDGIVNQGRSPVYAETPFAVFPVAVGDTVPKRDVSLTSLTYNKVAFSGDRFPVVAEVRTDGYRTGTATVLLREGATVLGRKVVELNAGRLVQEVAFDVLAPAPGKRHYVVEVEPVTGEFTRLNNTKNAYIEVVKGRLRVLVAGAAPHPDLNAFRAALATNANFETDLYLPGVKPLTRQDYDAVVLHQLPTRSALGAEVLALVRTRRLPALYVLGAQSDLAAFNEQGAGLNVQPRGQQTDEVTAALNSGFKRFNLAENLAARVRDFPPADVPFAEFRASPAAEVLLWQQVGRVPTTRPLLTVLNRPGSQRAAVLVAENTWQWRLTEAAAHDSQPEAYDRLVNGLVQLLTTADNKKKLRVFPRQDELTTADDVVFGVEAYNALFERVYGQNVTVTLTDEQNQPRTFSFVNTEGEAGLNVGSLPGGLYRYVARATVEGQPQQDAGELVVQQLQLEALQATADHNLLNQVARRSGGQLFYPSQLAELTAALQKRQFPAVLHADEQVRDLINLPWLFFVLLALLTLEWAARKYFGGY